MNFGRFSEKIEGLEPKQTAKLSAGPLFCI